MNTRPFHAAAVITSLAALAFSQVACKPVPRDPSGRVLFDPNMISHVEGSPYWCFHTEDQDGERGLSNCTGHRDSCMSHLLTSVRSGSYVSERCEKTDQVWCFTTGRSFNATSQVTYCQESAKDCEAAARKTSAYFGGDLNQVSACTMLDRSFASRDTIPREKRGRRAAEAQRTDQDN